MGFGPKARRYVKASAKVTKSTASVSARQAETKRVSERYGFATLERATLARREGGLHYESQDQAERVAKAAEWLINPDTTDDDKRPLDPRAVLDWLVDLPSKYSPGAIFVMYSFSYDVTHILRHLRFDKAWQVFKEETYDKDRKKRRKVQSRVFCGEPFNEFVMKYRNRKQLDIWKLRDPKYPYKRDETGVYVLNKDGHKIMDTIGHITLFDTHPFYQQSFVKR
jgi:hypothetical protein